MAPAAPSSPSSAAAAAASQQPHRGASLTGPGKEEDRGGGEGAGEGAAEKGDAGQPGSGAAAPEPLRAGAETDRSRP